MHIIVCIKQVPDPEAPPSAFKVDEGAKKVALAPGVGAVPEAVERGMQVLDLAEMLAMTTGTGSAPAPSTDAAAPPADPPPTE